MLTGGDGMRINTRFTVAIHMLALIELNKTQPSTSDLMALSVGTNPVVIRQLMTALKKAGLIESQVGVPGSRLAKPQEEITLLDIYRAVQKRSNACLFDFHPTPNPMCPIGRNIEEALDEPLFIAQTAMEKALESFTLKDITAYISDNSK